MKILVKRLNEKAKLPYQTYPSDFCYDVVATSCEEVAPNVYKYGLGIAMMMDPRERNFIHDKIKTCIEFRPRSSVWKTGMVLSNCTGTIDEHYRGEICAVFYHVMPKMPKYEIGDRIGQVYFNTAVSVDWEEVDTLDTTDRGEGGYGSTGK